MSVVERRPDKIVHAGIDDHEIFGVAVLHMQDPRHQNAGIADNEPAWLQDQAAAEILRGAFDDRRIGVRIGRRLVVLAIGHAKPATDIDVRNCMTVGAEHADEFREQGERVPERLQVDDLAADMHVDADGADALELGGAGIDFGSAADRNTELVLGFAGRDLGVCLRIDVRIDPDGNIGSARLCRRDRRQKLELGFRFDIDAEDAVLDGECEFTRGLADTGEHDALRRNAGGERAQEFTFGDDVRPGAETSERGHHRLVRVRLQRVTHKRIDIGKGGGEDIVMPLDGGAGIAIERRADDVGQRGEVDRFGMKHAVAVGEVMHGRCLEHESHSENRFRHRERPRPRSPGELRRV